VLHHEGDPDSRHQHEAQHRAIRATCFVPVVSLVEGLWRQMAATPMANTNGRIDQGRPRLSDSDSKKAPNSCLRAFPPSERSGLKSTNTVTVNHTSQPKMPAIRYHPQGDYAFFIRRRLEPIKVPHKSEKA
jgi:hypothetical protein